MDQRIATEYIAKTKSEASEFLFGLQSINSASFTTNQTIVEALNNTFSYDIAHRILLLCKDHGVDINNPQAAQSFLKQLGSQLENLPVISITIAFPAKEKTINAMYNWFLYQLKKQVLLDIHADESIIASAIIAYKGKYKDYSLSKKIHEQNVSN